MTEVGWYCRQPGWKEEKGTGKGEGNNQDQQQGLAAGASQTAMFCLSRSVLLATPYTHSLRHTREWKGDQSTEHGSRLSGSLGSGTGEPGQNRKRKETPPCTEGLFPLSGSPSPTHWPGLTGKTNPVKSSSEFLLFTVRASRWWSLRH